MCPNLEILSLDSFWDPESPLRRFLRGLGRQAITIPSRVLSNLRVVKLSQLYRDDVSGLVEVFPVLGHLRSVELLAVNSCFKPITSLPTLPNSASRLTKLHFRCPPINFVQLGAIVRHCEALKELKYIQPERTWDYNSSKWDPRIIGHALSQHLSTLSVLELDIGRLLPHAPSPYNPSAAGNWDCREDHYADEYRSSGYPPEIPCIRSLSRFTALKDLTVNISALLGWPDLARTSYPSRFRLIRHLPPNLERLEILDYYFGECAEYTKQMRHLLKEQARMPNLKDIIGVTVPPPKQRARRR